MSIGNNIKKFRKEKKIAQKEFEVIGISQSYLSQIESNKVPVSFELLNRIADFLDVGILELMEIPITEDNFLSFLKNLDETFQLDVLEVKRANGLNRYGIFINNDSIQKKLQLYKLMKDLNNHPNSIDKNVFASLLKAKDKI